jgi:hypothetical protein
MKKQAIVTGDRDVLILKEILDDTLTIGVYTDMSPVAITLSKENVVELYNHLTDWLNAREVDDL